MVNWRIITLIGLLFYSAFTLPSAVQSQSSLNTEELWQYGRGVIYDFDWSEQNLAFAAGGEIWQVDPLSGQPPTADAADFFPLLTSPDGTRFVAQGRGDMPIHDTHTGEIITRIPRSYFAKRAAAWQPNTNRLTTQGYNRDSPEHPHYLELWDTDSGELVGTVGGYVDGIREFSWHPAGNLLAVSLIGGMIVIEDAMRGERVHTLTVDRTSWAITWSPDGTKLAATASSQSPVNLWQTDTFEPITAPNHPVFIVSLAWNTDSTQLAGALLGGGVGVWNIETGEFTSLGIEDADDIDRVVEHMAWQGNLLATLDRTQRLRVWNADENELVWDSTEYQFHSTVRGFAVSPDGAWVALGYYNSRRIDILDGRTGALIRRLEAPKRLEITDMAWSPSGQQLAAASTTLYLWSFEPDAPASPIEVADVNYVSWSPDGLLAVASTYHLRGELRVIDGQTGEQIESHEVSRSVSFPHWSPDGRYIAVYRYNPPGEDDTLPPYQIDIWDVQGDVMTTVYFPHSDERRIMPSQRFVWLSDSSGLTGYTTGGDLWRWHIGAQEAEIVMPGPSMDVTNQSFLLSINASGDLLAVSNLRTDWGLHILDAQSGTFLLALDDLATGPRLFTWGGEDTLFVYDSVLRAYQITPD